MSTRADPVAPKSNPNEPAADAALFTRLGRFAFRRRRAVLVGTALFIVVAAVLGTGTFARLKSGGFQDPGAQSTKAENILKHG